jgi:nitroreductase
MKNNMATAHHLDLHTTRKEKSFSQAIEERRATPNFDSSPIPQEDIAAIVRAGLEAPSGYNLQSWRFVVVQNPEQKKKLREAAFNQPKVEEASAVIVACGDPKGWQDGDLDEMLRLAGEHGYGNKETHEVIRKNVTGALGSPAGDVMGVGPDWGVWVNRHVMIAFTTMMWMAEVLGYDTAPMEGFIESKVRAALGIPERVRVVALLAVGHRKGNDKPYGGRFDPKRTAFAEQWGKPLLK